MAKTPRKPTRKPKTTAGTKPKPKARANPKTTAKAGGRGAPAAKNKPRPERGSLHHYHTLFEHARDGVYLETLEGEIIDINPAGARMLGYEPAELIGTSVADIVTPEVVGRLGTVAEDLLRTKSLTIEAENIRKDGVVIPVEVSLSLVEGSGDNLVVAIVRDISERKANEESRQQAEARFRSVVENAPDTIAMVDRNGVFQFINRIVSGLRRSQVIGSRMHDYVPEEYRSVLDEALTSAFDLRKPYSYEIPGTGPEGGNAWYSSHLAPVQGDGEIIGAIMIARDITDRRRMEEALRESEEKYRFLAEGSVQGIAIIQGFPPRAVFANQALADLAGMTRDEFLALDGEQILSLIHPDDRDPFLERFKIRVAGNVLSEPTVFRALRPDGTWRSVEIRSKPITYDGEPSLHATFMDITDRKKAEQALRDSETRFRAVVQDQMELICRFLPDTTLTFVNDVYARAFGKTPEELVGSRFLPLIPEEDQERVMRQIASLDRKHPVSTHDHHVLMPGGEIAWQQWTNRALFDDEGNVTEFQSVGRDITGRKRAAEALRQSEQTARAFLNATKDLAVMVDTEGRAIMLNETIAETLGGTAEDLVGTIIYDFFPPAIASARRGVAAGVIDSRQPMDYEEIVGGRVFANRVHPLLGPTGNVERLVVFATDVTEQRHAESLRRQTEKSQAIAILAGGIAQNFRDVLMSVTASTTLLRNQIRDAESPTDSLDRIEGGCTRISHLVDEVFSIAGKLFPDPKRIQPNECVMQAVSGLSDKLPGGERFETALAPDLHLIQADREHVARVLSNILENAVEAVAGGGDIRILTENVSQVPSSVADKLRVSHGPFLHVHIADTGCGMTSEELAQVFDPFFSTKQFGRGMGMAVAKAVIEHYGGFIFLDSEKGRGARVHVYMPAERADSVAWNHD